MTDKERIEELKDFLGNQLNVGDNVVINQNTRTGSSTIRKILKRATIIGFTKCQVITTEGRIYPDDIIKISKDNQNAKAVSALEKVKDQILKHEEIYYQEKYPFVCVVNLDIKKEIDNLIKEYGGKE